MLLKISEIKSQCFAKTYERGMALFEDGMCRDVQSKVHQKANAEVWEPPETLITGQVQGSGTKWYCVSLTVDPDGYISEYQCDCPAYDNYYGMCKHCVALALHFRNMQSNIQASRKPGASAGAAANTEAQASQPGAASEAGTAAAQEAASATDAPDAGTFMDGRTLPRVSARHTSIALAHLMRRYSYESMGYLLGQYSHCIEFVPEFCFLGDHEALALSFKIGYKKMYVVKNIASVLNAIDTVSERTYGKNLSFIHDRSVFTDEALEWLDIARDILKVTYGIHSFGDYEDRRYNETLRQIRLNDYGVQRCLERMVGRKVTIGRKNYEVVAKNPRLSIAIERTDDLGARLVLNPIRAVEGNKNLFVVGENTIYQCDAAFEEKLLPLIDAMHGIVKGYDFATHQLYLSRRDFRLFCKSVLPVIEEWMDVTQNAVDFGDYMPEAAVLKVYLSMADDAGWRVALKGEVEVAGRSFDLFGSGGVEYRDPAQEFLLKRLIARYFVQEEDGLWYCGNDSQVIELVQDGIAQMQQLAQVYVDEKIRGIRLLPTPKLSMGIRIKSRLLELEVESDLMNPAEIADILSAYRQKKKYYRLKNGDMITLESDGLELLDELSKGLDLDEKRFADDTVTLPAFRANYVDQTVHRLEAGTSVYRDKNFRKMIRDMKNYSDSDFDVPENIHASLRPYQQEGFRWLCTLAAYGLGGILADDMGLGKTLQMLAFVLLKQVKTLIVCPASLVYNWESEAARFTPSLKAVVIAGNAAVRQEQFRLAKEADLVITSYDMLKREVEAYQGLDFECMVLDEAQYIKNAGTLAAKSVKEIPSGLRFALTGTPIENRLSDLWSIFDFIMPGYLYTYQRFKNDFERPAVSGEDQKTLERLKHMVSPFILRRKKEDVLKDLPDKLEKTIYVKMDEQQEKLYRATASKLVMELARSSDADFGRDQIRILAELTRLRQICCAPDLCLEGYKGRSGKMDTCLELMDNAIAGGHRLLVFSQFTSMLEKLIDAYKEKGDYLYLSGKTTKEARREMVARFQQGDVPVFFISLKAGGTGLNLTAADMVIHYDPWWNVAAQNQATDRTHRIGQKNVVTVLKLVMKNTIEERILELQEKKELLARNVIEGQEAASYEISREELLRLLGE